MSEVKWPISWQDVKNMLGNVSSDWDSITNKPFGEIFRISLCPTTYPENFESFTEQQVKDYLDGIYETVNDEAYKLSDQTLAFKDVRGSVIDARVPSGEGITVPMESYEMASTGVLAVSAGDISLIVVNSATGISDGVYMDISSVVDLYMVAYSDYVSFVFTKVNRVPDTYLPDRLQPYYFDMGQNGCGFSDPLTPGATMTAINRNQHDELLEALRKGRRVIISEVSCYIGSTTSTGIILHGPSSSAPYGLAGNYSYSFSASWNDGEGYIRTVILVVAPDTSITATMNKVALYTE